MPIGQSTIVNERLPSLPVGAGRYAIIALECLAERHF
jgi:hypothetical protein